MKNDTRHNQQLTDYQDFRKKYGLDEQEPDSILSISHQISLMIGQVFGAGKTGKEVPKLITPNSIEVPQYPELLDFYKDGIFGTADEEILIRIGDFGVKFNKSYNRGPVIGGLQNYFGEGCFMEICIAALYPSVMHKFQVNSRAIDPEFFKNNFSRKFDNYLYGAVALKASNAHDSLISQYIIHISSMFMMSLAGMLDSISDVIQIDVDTIIIKTSDETLIKNSLRRWASAIGGLKIGYTPFTKIYQKKVKEYIIIYNNGRYKSKGIKTTSKFKEEDIYYV